MRPEAQAISVVCAADNNYAMQVGTAIRSLLENHRRARPVDIWLLEDGITPENQARLNESWSVGNTQVHMVPCAGVQVPEVPRLDPHLKQYLSRAALLRLALHRLLPSDLVRFIYLDCDLLVLSEIEELWNEALPPGHVLAAVQDAAIPFHGSARPGCATPLLVDPQRPYFNSGVLLVDFAAWRTRRVSEQALELMSQTPHPLPFIDQDALNVVLDGLWAPLPPGWNCPSYYHFSKWRAHGFGNPLPYRDLSPKILHFCSYEKPWQATYPHRRGARLFYEYLDKTAWRGHRASRPWWNVWRCRRGLR